MSRRKITLYSKLVQLVSAQHFAQLMQRNGSDEGVHDLSHGRVVPITLHAERWNQRSALLQHVGKPEDVRREIRLRPSKF